MKNNVFFFKIFFGTWTFIFFLLFAQASIMSKNPLFILAGLGASIFSAHKIYALTEKHLTSIIVKIITYILISIHFLPLFLQLAGKLQPDWHTLLLAVTGLVIIYLEKNDHS